MASGPIRTYTGGGLQPQRCGQKAVLDNRVFAPGTYVKGQVLGETAVLTTANHVYTVTITGTPTGGTFILQWAGLNTVAIAYNAAAADVQAALDTITGAGNTVVTGGAGPGTPWVITAALALAGRRLTNMTVYSSSLTGGSSPAVAVVNTTLGRQVGGAAVAYNDGASTGEQVAKHLCQFDGTVDNFGVHLFGGEHNTDKSVAPVWVAGYFKTSDLTGLDAAAVADLGRIVSGDIGSLSNVATEILIT